MLKEEREKREKRRESTGRLLLRVEVRWGRIR
jgi:hypothetical protein